MRKAWKVVPTNRKCYIKYVVGVFFSPFEDSLKDIQQEPGSEEKQHTLSQEHTLYKIFWRCIRSFKMQRYVSDSCLPHFLSMLGGRYVFPLQRVTTNVIQRAANKS